MKTHSPQFLKRRKFFMVLPLLVIVFVTLAFWAMGGGTVSKEVPQQQQGLNKELPDAHLTKEPVDKMSLYNQAARDSIARLQQQGFGPFGQQDTAAEGISQDFLPGNDPYPAGGYAPGQGGLRGYADPNEVKVRDRLASLERALREPVPQGPSGFSGADQNGYNGTSGLGSDLDRLEQMMQSMTTGEASDPEMQQLSSMLEQILDIQNPGRAQMKLKELSQKNKGRVYAVNTAVEQKEAAIIKRPAIENTGENDTALSRPVRNAFYNLRSNTTTDQQQTAIPAVVHETQTLVSGSTVKLRLIEDIYINGMLIPSGNFVFGTCSVSGERLKIDIGGVRYGKSLFPVTLNVYDLDALEGIHIPGAISRDAAKEGTDRALQSVQFMSMDPSIAGQAAGVGVEAAKGLFGKKAKLVRVTVKAGYPVLLLDEKSRQEQSN